VPFTEVQFSGTNAISKTSSWPITLVRVTVVVVVDVVLVVDVVDVVVVVVVVVVVFGGNPASVVSFVLLLVSFVAFGAAEASVEAEFPPEEVVVDIALELSTTPRSSSFWW